MNKSGITPVANRVLIKPDPIREEEEDSLIHLPKSVVQRAEQGQSTGVLVAVGPDAFCHVVERKYAVHSNGERQLIEESVRGYLEPFAAIGDRIAFAKWSGRPFVGEDGERYLLTNDDDITGLVSDTLHLSDLDTRQGTKANEGLSHG